MIGQLRSIRPRSLLAGLRTRVPLLFHFRHMGGSAASARYCYAIWMRHLAKLHQAGMEALPKNVAELGPGGSLGACMAALLCGADRAIALDAVRHADPETNGRVLDELVVLFRQRAPIPGPDEFPSVRPELADYAFPRALLPDDVLERSLAPERVEAIRHSLDGVPGPLAYAAPWQQADIAPGSLGLIFSQAVLEHVDDVETAYALMGRWVRPGAWMSHVIDYACHNISSWWNGHWSCGPLAWKLVRGKRPFFINRLPHSAHLELIRKNGFDIVLEERRHEYTGLPENRLAEPFRSLPPEELSTSGSLIIARRGEDP